MAVNIHDLKQKFRGGVRPNLFRCNITHNVGLGEIEFLCKGAQIPASTLGNIDVPFRGRQLKVPGDRTFADWTVTVLSDPTFGTRGGFEEWSGKINHHAANVSTLNYTSLYGQATVIQLGRSGNAIRAYKLHDIYPIEIGAIDLAMDTNDTVEEYTVTFAVNNWSSDDSAGFDAGLTQDNDWEIGIRARTQIGPFSIGVNETIGGNF